MPYPVPIIALLVGPGEHGPVELTMAAGFLSSRHPGEGHHRLYLQFRGQQDGTAQGGGMGARQSRIGMQGITVAGENPRCHPGLPELLPPVRQRSRVGEQSATGTMM